LDRCNTWHPRLACLDHRLDRVVLVDRLDQVGLVDQVVPVGLVRLDLLELVDHSDLWDLVVQGHQLDLWVHVDSCHWCHQFLAVL